MSSMSDASRPKFNSKYYDEAYFDTASKTYRDEKGKIKKWGYIDSSTVGWEGWKEIAPVLLKMFNPKRVIDVGAGTGTLLPYLQGHAETWGFDFSRYAVTHCLKKAKGYMLNADARFIPFKDRSFDLVFCSDLLEHIYEVDCDAVIDELFRIAVKWVFLQIASFTEGINSMKSCALKKGEKPPLELEGLTVAGHVNVQRRSWWINRLMRKGWRFREDLAEQFRSLINPEVITAWRNIMILEKSSSLDKGYLEIYNHSSKYHVENVKQQGELMPFGYPEPDPAQLKRIDFIIKNCKGLTLDLGCDCGYILSKINPGIGIDIAHARVKSAKQNYRALQVFQATSEHLPFMQKFDTVVAAELLEHVPNPEKVLEQAHQVLKKGGILIVTVPNEHEGKTQDNPEHLRKFKLEEIKRLISLRFQVKHVQRIKGEHVFLIVVAEK